MGESVFDWECVCDCEFVGVGVKEKERGDNVGEKECVGVYDRKEEFVWITLWVGVYVYVCERKRGRANIIWNRTHFDRPDSWDGIYQLYKLVNNRIDWFLDSFVLMAYQPKWII